MYNKIKLDIDRIISNLKFFLTTEKIQELLPKIKAIVTYKDYITLDKKYEIIFTSSKMYCWGNCFRNTSRGELCIEYIEQLVKQLTTDTKVLAIDELKTLSYNFYDCYYLQIDKISLCLTCLFNIIDKTDLQTIITNKVTIKTPQPIKLNPFQKYSKNYIPPDTSTVLDPMLYRELKSGWITVRDSGVATSFTLVNDIPNELTELREFKFSQDIIDKSYRCSYCHFIYNNKHAFTCTFKTDSILYSCITCFLKYPNTHIQFMNHAQYIPSCNNMSFNRIRKSIKRKSGKRKSGKRKSGKRKSSKRKSSKRKSRR